MLTPADILAAKLLVQLGYLTADRVRQTLRHLADQPESVVDLVARLYQEGLLQREHVSYARRCVAAYELVRAEACYLRLLEKRKLPRAEVHELIARIEQSAYRHRLGALLVGQGRLTAEQDQALRDEVRGFIQREDARIVARYRADDYEGVARPLLPRRPKDLSAFKVSTIFRSRETREVVKGLVRRFEEEASRLIPDAMPAPAAPVVLPEAQIEPPPPPQAPPPSAEAVRAGEAGVAAQSTARFRKQASISTLVTGRQRIGAYEVRERLGQGNMGAVYLCASPGGSPLVAIKVRLERGADPDGEARFERERLLSSRVSHPRVMQVLAQGTTDDGLSYLVTPYYPGKPLKTAQREAGGPLPLEQAFRILEQVLEGVGGIHEAGIVHRDLKPENVLLLDDGAVKVMDLGIARVSEARAETKGPAGFRTAPGVISGSPAYVAPETITDETWEPRTDIYSLGVMAFELLTGRLPLTADSPYEFLREHLMGVPLTLGQARRDVPWPEGLERLVASMLAKDPADRPASCGAVLDALRAGGLRERTLRPAADAPRVTSLFNSFFRMLGRQ